MQPELTTTQTSHFILMKDSRHCCLQTDDLFQVQVYEDKINECIMTLESNADNMTSLSSFYTTIVKDDEFPNPEYTQCNQAVKKFCSQLQELIYDTNMHARRAKVLIKIMADRKAMVRVANSTLNLFSDLSPVHPNASSSSSRARGTIIVNHVAPSRAIFLRSSRHARHYCHNTSLLTTNFCIRK
jgi:hypothetical protein